MTLGVSALVSIHIDNRLLLREIGTQIGNRSGRICNLQLSLDLPGSELLASGEVVEEALDVSGGLAHTLLYFLFFCSCLLDSIQQVSKVLEIFINEVEVCRRDFITQLVVKVIEGILGIIVKATDAEFNRLLLILENGIGLNNVTETTG